MERFARIIVAILAIFALTAIRISTRGATPWANLPGCAVTQPTPFGTITPNGNVGTPGFVVTSGGCISRPGLGVSNPAPYQPLGG